MTPLSLELWYTALAEPFGICVQVSDLTAARQKLYALRKTANDPDLEKLSLVQSPTDLLQLWIVKR